MQPQLSDYITKARDMGKTDAEIKQALVGAGWREADVAAALSGSDDLPVPPPPPSGGRAITPANQGAPVMVVSGLSSRGLEYLIMFIAMGITATALGWLLHNSIDLTMAAGGYSSSSVPLAGAALIVGLPIFGYLFLRLKKAELANLALKKDHSRQKLVQTTLLVTFVIGIGHTVLYVYSLLNSGGDSLFDTNVNPLTNFLHLLVTLVIAGGIFVYYWVDNHRNAT